MPKPYENLFDARKNDITQISHTTKALINGIIYSSDPIHLQSLKIDLFGI